MRENNEKLYVARGQLKAEIDVYPTHEREAPSIKNCRHAVLHIQNKKHNGEDGHGYVVYDRLLNRIVNGVFYGDLESVLEVAQLYNEGAGAIDMSPNGLALGLIYPDSQEQEQAS